MTQNSYFSEQILSLVDFQQVFRQEVSQLVNYIKQEERSARKTTELVTCQEMVMLYKSSANFRNQDNLKMCFIIIHLLLAL